MLLKMLCLFISLPKEIITADFIEYVAKGSIFG